jgi:hypothetical protein
MFALFAYFVFMSAPGIAYPVKSAHCVRILGDVVQSSTDVQWEMILALCEMCWFLFLWRCGHCKAIKGGFIYVWMMCPSALASAGNQVKLAFGMFFVMDYAARVYMWFQYAPGAVTCHLGPGISANEVEFAANADTYSNFIA